MKISEVTGMPTLLKALDVQDELHNFITVDGVEWLLIGEASDDDECVVQMAIVEGKGLVVMNLWDTICVTVSPNCADLKTVVDKVITMDFELNDSLA